MNMFKNFRRALADMIYPLPKLTAWERFEKVLPDLLAHATHVIGHVAQRKDSDRIEGHVLKLADRVCALEEKVIFGEGPKHGESRGDFIVRAPMGHPLAEVPKPGSVEYLSDVWNAKGSHWKRTAL
jgi:hypothetical protein